MRAILAPALTALLCATISAQEIWVDPVNGVDTNPGTASQPIQTVTQANYNAGPNTTVFLLPGTYGPMSNGETLPIAFGNAGPQDNLVVRGIGTVIFDLAGSTSSVIYFGPAANNARLTNITFTNSDIAGWWTRVINSGTGVNSGAAASGVEIDRCRFVNINRGFVLWTADNTQGWKIHNNLFVNLANDAILEYTGTNEVFNNTFVTGAFKAYISDSMDSVCYNNLIVGYNIAFENNNPANMLSRYQNNWIDQTTTVVTQGPGFAGPLPASNTVGADPMLVNFAMGDYHPLPNSPLVEGGNSNLPNIRADLDGNSGIVDYDLSGTQEIDIGAYELSPVSMTSSYDGVSRILTVNVAATSPGLLAFVLFSFDEGLVKLPGQSPILLDQQLYLGSLTGGFPQTWPLVLSNIPPFAPGTRIVMQVVGYRPGVPIIGGNQEWVQL